MLAARFTMLQFAIRYRLQTCSQEQKKRKRSGEIEALSLPTVAKYFGMPAKAPVPVSPRRKSDLSQEFHSFTVQEFL